MGGTSAKDQIATRKLHGLIDSILETVCSDALASQEASLKAIVRHYAKNFFSNVHSPFLP